MGFQSPLYHVLGTANPDVVDAAKAKIQSGEWTPVTTSQGGTDYTIGYRDAQGNIVGQGLVEPEGLADYQTAQTYAKYHEQLQEQVEAATGEKREPTRAEWEGGVLTPLEDQSIDYVSTPTGVISAQQYMESFNQPFSQPQFKRELPTYEEWKQENLWETEYKPAPSPVREALAFFMAPYKLREPVEEYAQSTLNPMRYVGEIYPRTFEEGGKAYGFPEMQQGRSGTATYTMPEISEAPPATKLDYDIAQLFYRKGGDVTEEEIRALEKKYEQEAMQKATPGLLGASFGLGVVSELIPPLGFVMGGTSVAQAVLSPGETWAGIKENPLLFLGETAAFMAGAGAISLGKGGLRYEAQKVRVEEAMARARTSAPDKWIEVSRENRGKLQNFKLSTEEKLYLEKVINEGYIVRVIKSKVTPSPEDAKILPESKGTFFDIYNRAGNRVDRVMIGTVEAKLGKDVSMLKTYSNIDYVLSNKMMEGKGRIITGKESMVGNIALKRPDGLTGIGPYFESDIVPAFKGQVTDILEKAKVTKKINIPVYEEIGPSLGLPEGIKVRVGTRFAVATESELRGLGTESINLGRPGKPYTAKLYTSLLKPWEKEEIFSMGKLGKEWKGAEPLSKSKAFLLYEQGGKGFDLDMFKASGEGRIELGFSYQTSNYFRGGGLGFSSFAKELKKVSATKGKIITKEQAFEIYKTLKDIYGGVAKPVQADEIFMPKMSARKYNSLLRQETANAKFFEFTKRMAEIKEGMKLYQESEFTAFSFPPQSLAKATIKQATLFFGKENVKFKPAEITSFILPAKTKVIQKSLSLNKQSNLLKLNLQSEQRTEQLQRQEQRQQQRQIQRMEQRSEQRQEQLQRQEQRQQQRQIQRMEQRQVTRQNINRIFNPLPPVTPPPKIKLKTIISFGEQKKAMARKKQQAFLAFIKRKGKMIALGGPAGRAETLRRGEAEAMRTAGATFMIKPVKGTFVLGEEKQYQPSNIFRSYAIRKGKRVPLQDTFIQRRGQRIISFGEKSEISYAGIRARQGRAKLL